MADAPKDLIEHGNLITEKEMIKILLTEAQNNLTKCQLMDRLFKRIQAEKWFSQEDALKMGANQKAIRRLEKTIADLVEFYPEASVIPPLADIFKTGDN